MSRLYNALRDTVDALRRIRAAPFEPAPPETWLRKDDDGPVRCPCMRGARAGAGQALFGEDPAEGSASGASGLRRQVRRQDAQRMARRNSGAGSCPSVVKRASPAADRQLAAARRLRTP